MRPPRERPHRSRDRTTPGRLLEESGSEKPSEAVRTRRFRRLGRSRRSSRSDATRADRRGLQWRTEPGPLAVFTVFVGLALTAALTAFVSLTAGWLDTAPVDTARAIRPFSSRLVAGVGLGPFLEWSVLLAGIATLTGCLGVSVVAVRLLIRLYARRAVNSR